MARFPITAFTVVLLVGSLAACGNESAAENPDSNTAEQDKGGEEPYLTGPYEVQTNWPQPLPDHEDWVWGATTGIYAESPDRVFVVQRGELPRPEGIEPGWDAIAATPGNRAIGGNRFEHCIYVVDSSGRIIEAWDQWDHLFPGGRGPHQVAINPYDPERHVWVVDDLLHQVFKFTNDGEELVLTLGERLVPGDDGAHFNRPTGIAFFPDGSTFVSDGYTNTPRGEVRRGGQLPHGLGGTRNRSRPVQSAPRDRHGRQRAGLRGGSLEQSHSGVRRKWKLSGRLARHQLALRHPGVGRWTPVGRGRADQQDAEIQSGRAAGLRVRHLRPGAWIQLGNPRVPR